MNDDKFAVTMSDFDEEETTQSIVLSSLFTKDVTATGSFDIRGEIRKSTFGKLIQAVPVPTLLIDKEFRVVVVNQAWAKVIENHEELQGKIFLEFFADPENAKRVRSILEEVFSTRQPCVVETAIDFSEKQIWGRITCRSIRIMEERCILILVEDLTTERRLLQQTRKYQQELEQRVQERTAELLAANAKLQEEVSERKRAEEAAKVNEQRFKELAELLPQFVYELDLDGTFTFVNQAGQEAIGFTAEDFRNGLHVRDLVPLEDKGRLAKDMAKILAGEKTGGYEFAFRRKDGQTLQLVAYHAPIWREMRIEGVRGVAVDITERKAVEEALATSEERYRTIIENIEDGYYEVDLGGNLQFVNDSFARILGCAKADLAGRKFKDFTDEAGASKVTEIFDRVLNSATPLKAYGFEFRTNDGVRRSVEASVSPVRGRNGESCGFRGIVRDVTERKAQEELLLQTERHKALGQMGSGVAHSFNNLLQIIMGKTRTAFEISQISLGNLREFQLLLRATTSSTARRRHPERNG